MSIHNWTAQQALLRDPNAPDDADESTDQTAARYTPYDIMTGRDNETATDEAPGREEESVNNR